MERLGEGDSESYGPNIALDFKEYRDFIDRATPGYRKIGLLDPNLADLSMKDARSLTFGFNSLVYPVFVPIDYVMGYDPNRCKELSKRDGECFYLSISSHMQNLGLDVQQLSRQIAERLKSGDSIFFDYSLSDESSKALLSTVFEPLSKFLEPIDLKDPKAKKDVKQASMALYSSELIQTDVSIPYVGKEISQLNENYLGAYPENGFGVYGFSNLTPQIINKLWLLFRERFNKLGEFHPLSMEDTRETFDDLIEQNGVLVPVCFREGEPKAMSLVFTNPESCTWLNSSFMKNMKSGQKGKEFMFFGAIAAQNDAEAGSFMREIIFEFTKDLATIGRNIWLLYETSNRSERVIPKYTNLFVKESGRFTVEPHGVVDRHIYEAFGVK